MFKRVLLQSAAVFAVFALATPAHAGMVDDAMSTFIELDGYVQQANKQNEAWEGDNAKESLEEAQDSADEYGQLMDAIHDASDDLAGQLGDAWEQAMSDGATLSAKITDTMGRIDGGSADFPGLLSAADTAESSFNAAKQFTQQFKGKLFAFRAVTLNDMRATFDNELKPNVEAAKTAMLARNRNEAAAAIGRAKTAADKLVGQANDAKSMTVTLGDSVTEATENLAPYFAAVQKDVQGLEAVLGSNPNNAITTVSSSMATADKEITDSVNRMGGLESQFVLICDSNCR